LADINYPDGSQFPPGFNKGWRLSNCGDTTWDSSYRAIRISGSYGPVSFAVPAVAPGQTGELWATFTAPTTPNTYRATYKLEGPSGQFGDPFWVEIVVIAPPPATIIVDDGDSGFLLFGPSAYWHREKIGYGGDMYWTYVNGTVVSNKVQWKPKLSGSGNYKVQAFIPYNHATSQKAKYTVRANAAAIQLPSTNRSTTINGLRSELSISTAPILETSMYS
jgi:hypothetical protein